ncbi:MAG: fatty acid desaturase [Gammaproteobacteria bacterium]|nr:fatty acid desaturase [Gammaproteobacteria bacterium]
MNVNSTSENISNHNWKSPHITIEAKKAVPASLLLKVNLKDIAKYMAQEWIMIILTWLVLWFAPIWLYPLGALVISGRFIALGALLHDACHVKRVDSVYSSLVDWLGGYPIGLSIESMRYHHLRHHRYACSHDDPYLKTGVESSRILRVFSYLRGILVIIAWCIRPYFGLIARIYPELKNQYAKVFFGDKTSDNLRDSNEIDLCMAKDIGQIIYQSLLIVLCVVFTHWMILYYIIPLVVASILNSYRVVEEHTHEVTNDHSPINIVQYTNDQPAGLLLRFFIFPRNIGYHKMHHLHPAVRFEMLPKLQHWYMNYKGPTQ